ncbi:MAG: phosphatidate cytidylyltransferase [Dehalococcoidia bacterium]
MNATAATAAGGHPRSNLQLRLMTAAIGLPLVSAVIWVGGWPFAVVAGAIATLAAIEFLHGWLFPTLPVSRAVRQFAPFAGAVGVMAAGTHSSPSFLLFGVAVALGLLALGYLPAGGRRPRRPFRIQGWALLYVGALIAVLVLARDVDQGRKWVFLGILATFAVDTGAYAVGRMFGRHKLAPKISPKKTWEGAVGGYAAGVAACFGLNALFETGVPWTTLSHFAFVMPIAAQVGDLFESGMKRRMGVKDASGLLPGHGGFLDRLDSIVFVIPLLYGFLQVRVL